MLPDQFVVYETVYVDEDAKAVDRLRDLFDCLTLPNVIPHDANAIWLLNNISTMKESMKAIIRL